MLARYLIEITYIRRCGAINEKHVGVIDTILRELGAVVLGLIQAHNMRHTEVPKDLQVIFWRVSTAVGALLIYWSHKGDKLLGEHPVKVAIFYLLIVLVLLVVKLSEVVPAKVDGDL